MVPQGCFYKLRVLCVGVLMMRALLSVLQPMIFGNSHIPSTAILLILPCRNSLDMPQNDFMGLHILKGSDPCIEHLADCES